MDKYTILIILNSPLALYGLFNVLLSYKLKRLRPSQALIRILFWGLLLIGIIFARQLSSLLYQQNLTDSPPLSIFDVVLVTGVMSSLLLVARAHGRIQELETKLTLLHERLSILLSNNKKN